MLRFCRILMITFLKTMRWWSYGKRQNWLFCVIVWKDLKALNVVKGKKELLFKSRRIFLVNLKADLK